MKHLHTPKPKGKQIKGLDDTHDEEDDDDEDEEVGTRGRKGRKSQEENKENARSKSGKRARNLFDLNIVLLEDMVKGFIKHRDGWRFDQPINKAVAQDYHRCVRHPIDLDTIVHQTQAE